MTVRAQRSSRSTSRPATAAVRAACGASSTTRRVTSSCECAPRACSRTEPLPARSTCASRSGSRSGSPCSTHGEPVFPKIKVFDRQGEVAFNALDTSPRWQEPATPGEYVSIAWIPGNLLNEGLISVDVAVCSLDGTKFHHRAGGAGCRVVPRSRSGAGRLGARPVHRAGARRRPALARVERGRAIVGIVLVRNEDVFLEQAIRNVAAFCDRIHAVDHVSTDGTWEVLRALDRELRPSRRAPRAACRRLAQARRAIRGHCHVGLRCRRRRALRPRSVSRAFARSCSAARTATSSRLPRTCSTASSSTGRRGRRPAISRRPHARSRSSTTSPRSSPGAATGPSGCTAGRSCSATVTTRARVDNIGERLPWEETPLRCLHACFLRRSTQEPRAHGRARRPADPRGDGHAGPQLCAVASSDACAGTQRRRSPRGRTRSTCAATSSRSTPAPFFPVS